MENQPTTLSFIEARDKSYELSALWYEEFEIRGHDGYLQTPFPDNTVLTSIINSTICLSHYSLHLNEKDKPLCNFFIETEGNTLLGPIEYHYPNGTFAGLEYHEGLSDGPTKINESKTFWFSPEGESIDKDTFEFQYAEKLKEAGVERLNIFPIYRYLETLAFDFRKAISEEDRSHLSEFKDKMSSLPIWKLKIVDSFITKFHSLDKNPKVDSNSLRSLINRYVYGKTPSRKSAKEIYDGFKKSLNKTVGSGLQKKQ